MKTKLYTIHLKMRDFSLLGPPQDACKEAAAIVEEQFGPNYSVTHAPQEELGYETFTVAVEKHLVDMLTEREKLKAFTEGALSGVIWAKMRPVTAK